MNRPVKRVGVIYHPKIPAAKALSERLSEVLPSMRASAWACSSWDEEDMRTQLQDTDLVISVGGDGTILRVARAVAFQNIPIVGVNLGHLGFMTEFSADDLLEKLPAVLCGEGWIDQRTMLQVDLSSETNGRTDKGLPRSFHALNDVLIGRGSVPRIIQVSAAVNGAPLTTYRADGVIISTATGSTGYSLAAGGPILFPQAEEIMVTPVSAHLSLSYALVLPSTAVVEMQVHTYHEAVLSVDGQINLALQDGDRITAKRSQQVARFLRMYPRDFFYSALEQRLRVKVRD